MKFPIIMALLLAFQIFGYTSCKKVTEDPNGTDHNFQNSQKNNTAPKANAGVDTTLRLPKNEIILLGSCTDSENNILDVNWEKISGPDTFQLDTKKIFQPRLSHLVKGEYQFELTVTDMFGLFDKDTIKITVLEPAIMLGNEIIFKDQPWTYPWYASIEINDFNSWIPAGAQFRVFIKRDGASDWIEANPISFLNSSVPYEYFIETRPDGAGMYIYGSLYIFYYGMDTDDTPDVKIAY